jgi:hypothetical protein
MRCPPYCVADTTTHEVKKQHLLCVYLNPLLTLHQNKELAL